VRMAKWLTKKGWYDEEANKKLIERTRQDVLAALKESEKVPVNPIEDIVNDVYSEVPWHLQDQLEQLKSHIKKYPKVYPKTSGRIK